MLAETLNRTTLLMRTELVDGVDEDRLLAALTGVTVVISANAAVANTAAGRTAITTASLLMARSGHEVWVWCPDAVLAEPQPPMTGGTLHEAIIQVGNDLVPGRTIQVGMPKTPIHLNVVFGDGPEAIADHTVWLSASDWSATLTETSGPVWSADTWPIGAMATASMAAAEAFKVAMRRLGDVARSPAAFDLQFGPTKSAHIDLASPETPRNSDLGEFDMVSGGAIANAALFTLLRIPGVSGDCRVLDDDDASLSNLNRNALLVRSAVGQSKVRDLARYGQGLKIEPVHLRYQAGMSLRPIVLVGVDDIPSRWAAQSTNPAWLGVGATAGFSVQVSSHSPDTACAGCLHPVAGETTGPIPTVAFVSFWSGLLLAVRFLVHRAGVSQSDRQTYFSALRSEGWLYADLGVSARVDCPVLCATSIDYAKR